jgi:hypothetical protein
MSRAMRGAAGLAMVVGLCGACFLPYGPYYSPPPARPAPLVNVTAPEIAPVQARLMTPFDGLLVFDVNQPVYVAVFDVRPSIAMKLLFPGPDDDGRVEAGVHGVATFYLTQAHEERQALYTPAVGGGEEYLYLVASRVPLDLSALAPHPTYDEDWDADVYIVTPAQAWPMSPHRTIVCDDRGTVAFMPVSYPFSICPRYDHVVSSAGQQLAQIGSVQSALLKTAVRTDFHKPLTIGPWHPIPVTHAFNARSTADGGGRSASAPAVGRIYAGNRGGPVSRAQSQGSVSYSSRPSAGYSGGASSAASWHASPSASSSGGFSGGGFSGGGFSGGASAGGMGGGGAGHIGRP